MEAQRVASEARPPPEPETRVVLTGIGWELYEAIVEANERPGVRFAYLEGELEIMSPSKNHELAAKMIARLLEAFAEERGLEELNGFRSSTFRKRKKKRGLEPDECYVLGSVKDRGENVKRPDIAIEVVYSRWDIDKLAIYHGLGVPEVWVYQEGKIEVHVRTASDYDAGTRSSLLPDVDLALLASFVERDDQLDAVREYRRALRGE